LGDHVLSRHLTRLFVTLLAMRLINPLEDTQ
jgi:hypothetical protein